MAQAKRKTATKTKKKGQVQRQRSQQRCQQKKQPQQSNTFFLVSMSFLAATLLVMNLLMMSV